MSYSVVIKMGRSRAEFTKEKETNRVINHITFVNIYIYIYKETQMRIVLHRISGVLDT